MSSRDRRALPPTQPLGSGFVMDRAADLWDVVLAGIVSATGSLDDVEQAWQGVNWLRRRGRAFPLPVWWAAAARPDQVAQLVLPPVLTEAPAPGTVAAHTVSCLSVAGLIDIDHAAGWQQWENPLAGFAADVAATQVKRGSVELLGSTAGEQLEDMAVKLGRLNTGVRLGAAPQEFSERYLLAVASVTESLQYAAAGLARALSQVSEVLAPGGGEPDIHEVPQGLRTSVSAEIHLGFVQAATRIQLGGAPVG